VWTLKTRKRSKRLADLCPGDLSPKTRFLLDALSHARDHCRNLELFGHAYQVGLFTVIVKTRRQQSDHGP
jgi:hypothetical protein